MPVRLESRTWAIFKLESLPLDWFRIGNGDSDEGDRWFRTDGDQRSRRCLSATFVVVCLKQLMPGNLMKSVHRNTPYSNEDLRGVQDEKRD